jgi:F-type H+-transporting ATPase subunit delta
VASEKGTAQEWLAQLIDLGQLLVDRDLLVAMRSPNVTDDQKQAVIESLAPNLVPELRNLTRLLIRRSRIHIVPAVAEAFANYLDEARGRVEAEVTSARALSDDEVRAIEIQLNRRTGRTVTLKTALEPSLIGGIVIRVGDELIDASIATRLERLRQRMA